MEKYRIMVKSIINYAGKYLLLKKWYDDRIEEPFQWEFPDGMVEFGESPEHAALRIATETTGLTAEAMRPLYTWQYLLGDESVIGVCYLLYAHSDETVLSEEYTESIWVSRFDFEKYIKNMKLLADIQRVDL